MSGRTLLIVEDDPVVREGLARILEQQGYITIPTANGQEALQCLQEGPVPDLILLDMINAFSGGDGWDFLERRKRNFTLASVPVLILTGVGVASKEWAADLGAVGLLKKPFDAQPLLDEVGRCCTAMWPNS
jgi:CheY-like chemotaxis protein